MKRFAQHTDQVRENVFYFAGFDDWHREFVVEMTKGDRYLLVDGVLHSFTREGEPDIPLHKVTARFHNGFYLGHGSLGNGICYWDKRSEEFNDYKHIGQITQNGELIVRTEEPILLEFLKTEARPSVEIKEGGKE